MVTEDMANMGKQKHLKNEEMAVQQIRNQEMHLLKCSYMEIPFQSVTVLWNLYNNIKIFQCY